MAEGLSKIEKKEERLMDTNNSVAIARGREGSRGGHRGSKHDGRRLNLGGTHMIQCTHDVL